MLHLLFCTWDLDAAGMLLLAVRIAGTIRQCSGRFHCLCTLSLHCKWVVDLGAHAGFLQTHAVLCTLMLSEELFIRCGEGFGNPFTSHMLFLLWNLGFASQCSNF